MMTSPGKFTWARYDTLLRLDFVSFAQRCLRELSPPKGLELGSCP